jgi:hypothetical protein
VSFHIDRREGRNVVGLTNEQADLFREPNFAVAATLKTDGTPQTSVVWVGEENGRPVFNTNARAKGRHLRWDSRLSLLVWDRAVLPLDRGRKASPNSISTKSAEHQQALAQATYLQKEISHGR